MQDDNEGFLCAVDEPSKYTCVHIDWTLPAQPVSMEACSRLQDMRHPLYQVLACVYTGLVSRHYVAIGLV